VHLVGRLGIRCYFLAYGGDGVCVEGAEICAGLGIEPATVDDGLGATLFEGRIVEKGIGTSVEDLLGELRRLGEVLGDELHLAIVNRPQEALDVHGLLEAVADRLLDQRVLWDLALSLDILEAGQLIGKNDRDQIVGVHSLQRRRHLATAAKALHRQGTTGVPTPAHVEKRRVEQRLSEDVTHRVRVQVVEDLFEVKAVSEPQREHDGILGRCCLKLEVELATEALA